MIQGLSADFSIEVKSKQESLDVTQAHLRAATRELSEQRKQIQLWQSRCAELDQVHQRIRNLEKAISEEDDFDCTGRTDLAGQDASTTAGPAFQWRGPSSTMAAVAGSTDVPFTVEIDPPIPTADTAASLIRLRRLKMWHVRMEELLEARLKSLQGASAEKEYQCKRIVALCTGIPIDKVEDVSRSVVVWLISVPFLFTGFVCSDAGKPCDRDGKRGENRGYCSGVWIHAEGKHSVYPESIQFFLPTDSISAKLYVGQGRCDLIQFVFRCIVSSHVHTSLLYHILAMYYTQSELLQSLVHTLLCRNIVWCE